MFTWRHVTEIGHAPVFFNIWIKFSSFLIVQEILTLVQEKPDDTDVCGLLLRCKACIKPKKTRIQILKHRCKHFSF